MGSILLGLSSFSRAETAPVTLKNYYYESLPTNLEDQVALKPRPRLKQFAVVGVGPIRGLYREGGVLAETGYSGVIIALSNTELFRVTQAGQPGVGTATTIGTVEGPFRMTAEGSGSEVVLCCGTKLYSTDGAALTQLTMPDDFNAYAVDTLAGRYIIASDLGRFYWTAVGGTSISALDYATAESQPDVLMTLKVIDDELWLLGRVSIEVCQPTGDSDLPYQRIGGRTFGIGITARDTAQKFSINGNGVLCWVGTDRRAYKTAPNPTKISDHGMDERLARVSDDDIDALYAVPWNWEGHDFYVLHIPGEGSWGYDFTTERWHEMTSFERDLFRAAVGCLGPNNQPLLGDDEDGVIWEMSEDERTDGDDPVLYETTGLLEVTAGPQRCNDVSLDVMTGLNPDPEADPMMQMDWSDDQGRTFGTPATAPMGRQGVAYDVIRWMRLGMLRRPGRIFRWRTTEPVTIRKAKFNEAPKR